MQNYVGMVFDFSTEGTVVIEIKSYNEVLLEYTETKILFDVNYKNELLSDVERAKFHTVVAKLLYLLRSVHGQTDILLARVTQAIETVKMLRIPDRFEGYYFEIGWERL